MMGNTASRSETCTMEATNAAAMGASRACFRAAMLVRSDRSERWMVRQRPAWSPTAPAPTGGGARAGPGRGGGGAVRVAVREDIHERPYGQHDRRVAADDAGHQRHDEPG